MWRGCRMPAWPSSWINSPSRPFTGRGVVTTLASRNAMAQASSEAIASLEW
jgi:hypothetical protein